MCGVKREEGEDGGSQGGGLGSPMAAKGIPKHGADGCTDRSARTGEASVWERGAGGLVCRTEASHITKDMLPGPYPRTPEERAAAAKKYNMRVEDYEPYPDDGMGYGDYPKLPDRSQQERDPWYDWDHPELRLNWGEPMHWDLDMYIRNRVDTSPTPVSWNLMCKHLFGFVAFMLFMFWVGETYPTYQPVGPKQYPYNNLYLERGGDPSKEPEPVVHYEI
ncbi:NADH dehydrogenase [ubiquinone] 1 beta subcomplex subunit 8, mitochondrial isoform X1 [Monodon monoceros]|uniref:NADH dehydrogenase [ubiquinone] 1 beta subcomplex subunit 8, mitochondrial isoform X1 n=1 Tax=Delphinapterus leucas TaxID=9749 RepID=A0A2Y9N077_DELLE|nr:NADH dehydrogenase [ubiquinone] 1 beta subcomplex subunit 8, mitochondrial isoform X1 [Delphinapterus leucas]XP_029056949.1 NADH dehydrogenase [ubiquinone] 1 beta subcomplex subunit 8, mitochondrial isoform X1 [Monodon monoceros]